MAESLKGPCAKVERAKKHIEELEAAISGLVFSHSENPDVTAAEDDPATGDKIYKAAKVPCVPSEVAMIAGDAIHNLRSALDLLMTQLVERANNVPSDRNTPLFPTGKDRQSFESGCTPKIETLIGKDALHCVKASEPYRGGKGEAAWYLHRLDIEDKHRVVYKFGFNLAALTLTGPMWEPEGMPPWFSADAMNAALGEIMGGIFWKPADTLFPLKEGDTLLIDFPNPQSDSKFRFDVAFAEPQIVHAEPVLPALAQYREAIEALVDSFAPLF